jgi:hypothetical protein
MYCSFQQIFNCLLCCSLNPDEDICTVPSNGYFNCLLCRFIIPDEDICIIPWESNTIDNGISVGRNSTYVFIWIERTTQKTIEYQLEGTVHMSSSGLRKQYNRQLNICWKEQYRYPHNLDEDICTVPSNRYSIVYCAVLSFYMRISVLFLPTDIQLSIVLFPQSRWRQTQ